MSALAIAVLVWLIVSRSSTPPTAQSSAFLANAPNYIGHPTIDGIQCQNTEQVAYHIHSHLAVYVNGELKTIPEGIGIAAPRQTQSTPSGPFVVAGGCFYWLHTHDRTGVIHIESPSEQPYTLGNFFDIWQQPLSSSQVGPAAGTVYAYVNGQPYSGDPRQIQLAAHAVIQLDVGQNTPGPQPYTFAQGL